jgi:hypothetical protein
MSFGADIQIVGNPDAVEDRIDAVSDAVKDLSPVWPEVGAAFQARQRNIFATDGRGTWPFLAASTILRKGSATTLVRTGALQASVSSPVPSARGPQFAEFGGNNLGVGYIHWHVRGAGVPVRHPVPPLIASERKALIEPIREYVRKALAE